MSVSFCNDIDDWSTMEDCKVRVGGEWKQCETIHANINGEWKKVWPETVFLDPFYPYFASTGNQHTTGTALNQTATLSDLVIRKYTSSSSKGELFPEGTQFRIDQKGLGSGYVIFDLDAEGNVANITTNSDWTTTYTTFYSYDGFDDDHLGDVAVLTAVDGGAYWWDGTQAVSEVTLTINNLQILVATQGATKTFDGQALTNATMTIRFCPPNGLCEDSEEEYYVIARTTGSLIGPGTARNTYTVEFEKLSVFGDNYTFAENLGYLVVNAVPAAPVDNTPADNTPTDDDNDGIIPE